MVLDLAVAAGAALVVWFAPDIRWKQGAALAAFAWCLVTALVHVNAGYRAPFRIPKIERYFIIQKAGLEAGAVMSAWAMAPPPEGGGGDFAFLRTLTPERLNIFIANPVWTYRISLPADTLLELRMVLLEDPGMDPAFHNANGDTGLVQFRMDIRPGHLPSWESEN